MMQWMNSKRKFTFFSLSSRASKSNGNRNGTSFDCSLTGGTSLETIVRGTLRELGGQVEDPTDPGQEDGWVTIELKMDKPRAA